MPPSNTLKRLLTALWRRIPRSARLFGVRVMEPSFAVSVAGVITDGEGRLLLLKHVFRAGSTWGIPGGFLKKNEQPDAALRRELLEEASVKIETMRIAFARTRKPRNIEIIYVCTAPKELEREPRNIEISRAQWFPKDGLAAVLSRDQRYLIKRALHSGEQPF